MASFLLNGSFLIKKLNNSCSAKGDVPAFVLEASQVSVVVRLAVSLVLYNVHDVVFSSEDLLLKEIIKQHREGKKKNFFFFNVACQNN